MKTAYPSEGDQGLSSKGTYADRGHDVVRSQLVQHRDAPPRLDPTVQSWCALKYITPILLARIGCQKLDQAVVVGGELNSGYW